jgi:hypothetical protein
MTDKMPLGWAEGRPQALANHRWDNLHPGKGNPADRIPPLVALAVPTDHLSAVENWILVAVDATCGAHCRSASFTRSPLRRFAPRSGQISVCHIIGSK